MRSTLADLTTPDVPTTSGREPTEAEREAARIELAVLRLQGGLLVQRAGRSFAILIGFPVALAGARPRHRQRLHAHLPRRRAEREPRGEPARGDLDAGAPGRAAARLAGGGARGRAVPGGEGPDLGARPTRFGAGTVRVELAARPCTCGGREGRRRGSGSTRRWPSAPSRTPWARPCFATTASRSTRPSSPCARTTAASTAACATSSRSTTRTTPRPLRWPTSARSSNAPSRARSSAPCARSRTSTRPQRRARTPSRPASARRRAAARRIPRRR